MPMFITVGSCPGIAAGLITVCGANLSLVSTILIVKWNASATACITGASAHVPVLTYQLNILPMNPLQYFQ